MNQVQDKRRSERLKKDTCISTMEKNERMAAKRNLEGNSKNCNSFASLTVDEIAHLSSDMGIAMNNNNFETFDLIKELEKARNDLHNKKVDQLCTSQTESIGNGQDENTILELEWIQDESSDSEEFILVESRKKEEIKKKKCQD